MQNYIDRAMSRFIPEPNSGCWLWDAALDDKGYGRISVHGKWRHAHIIVYEINRGPVPDGLELDHLCRMPCCVNPDHLEPVTHQENIRRGAAAGTFGRGERKLTHCQKGHAYAGDNLYLAPNGWRQCMTCRRSTMREHYLRKKAQKGIE